MNDDFLQAVQFAKKAHKGQFRKYSHVHRPYIHHPLDVASVVALHPKATIYMVIAAVLHDVVEDTPITIQHIESEFGREVAEIVDGMTNPSKEHPELNRAARKEMDRIHLAGVAWEIKLVKLVDRIVNLRDLVFDKLAPKSFIEIYLTESQLLLDEALQGTDEELEAEYKVMLGHGYGRVGNPKEN